MTNDQTRELIRIETERENAAISERIEALAERIYLDWLRDQYASFVRLSDIGEPIRGEGFAASSFDLAEAFIREAWKRREGGR